MSKRATRPAADAGLALAVTVGDPCGIGPEIALKAVADRRARASGALVVVANERSLRRTARELKLAWPFVRVIRGGKMLRHGGGPTLLDLTDVDDQLVPGQISAHAGKAAGEAVEAAVALATAGVVDAIVTAPLNKESLALAGYNDLGHTEMLQRLTGAKQVGMLFWAKPMSVALLTTHLSLREAIRAIRAPRIVQQLVLFDAAWQRYFHRRPRIAVAGVNPHSGESGRFGSEETTHVIPAVEAAAKKGLTVSGPFPADSVFQRASRGEFDLVLALYHDQGTIPIKLLCGFDAVNVTVGLPFVRTSVDHGTAMDIAGKGIASARSLVQAIVVGARLVKSSRGAAAR